MAFNSLALVLMMAAPPKPASVLPLQRLRLYETGVAYFERRGKVAKRDALALPVPTGHLDDALKTLVVLDDGSGARVGGIAFSTAVSEGMARAMAGLPDQLDGVGYVDLLRSLEGTRVGVSTSRRKITGRLIDVEGPFGEAPSVDDEGKPITTPPPPPEYDLLVLTDTGELRRISTKDVTGVQPSDAAAADRLDVAAEALSDHTARQTQALDVRVETAGRLGLGYVAEAPVWRTSYRVVLGDDADKGRLQGWALVHNDTDEDWAGVEVELVNGRPASFLYPLAAPRYARRELVEPEEQLSTVPQLAKTTPDRMWLDGEEIGEAYGAGGLGLVGTGRGGGGTGEGSIGLGSHGTIGRGGGVGLSLGDLADLTKADAEPQGALFVYRVTDPVDLEAHHSALLPIVSEDIEAESITLFPRGEYEGFTGVRMVNTTTQTLPGGTVSFFSGGGFVGETVLGRLGPTERRFVVYGAELDVELTRGRTATGEEASGIRFDKGVLVETYVAKSTIHLGVTNRSRRAQRVYVGLDVSRNAKLTTEDDGVELDFDLETSTPLVAMTVPAGGETSPVLRAQTVALRRHEQTDAVTLEALAEREGLSEDTAKTLREALAQRREADRHRREADEAKRELTDATEDLGRIREDLGALGDAGVRGRLSDRLSRELLGKEKKIVQLRTSRRESLRAARRADRRVEATLEALK